MKPSRTWTRSLCSQPSDVRLGGFVVLIPVRKDLRAMRCLPIVAVGNVGWDSIDDAHARGGKGRPSAPARARKPRATRRPESLGHAITFDRRSPLYFLGWAVPTTASRDREKWIETGQHPCPWRLLGGVAAMGNAQKNGAGCRRRWAASTSVVSNFGNRRWSCPGAQAREARRETEGEWKGEDLTPS